MQIQTRMPLLISLLALAGVVAGSAQTPSAANPLGVEMVKTGLFVISGGGSNSVLRLSADGLIVVDGKLPGNYKALLGRTHKVSFSDQTVRVLINTDHHREHTGLNAEFLAGGAKVLAQEHAKENQIKFSAEEKPGLPTSTFDRESVLKFGGVEVQLLHFGKAHTNGDTVVFFPNLKVVAVGDLFAEVPDPDFAAGGSLVGWGPALGELLKLEFDVAVPGTGAVVTRTDVERLKTKLDTLVSRAAALVKEGADKDRLATQLKTDELGQRINLSGDRMDKFYAELQEVR